MKAHEPHPAAVESLDNNAPLRANSGRQGRLFDALAAAVSLVGLADAIYLTVEHLAGRSVRCVVVSGCDEVLASRYATLPGNIPLAAVGAVAYFTAFALATLSTFQYRATRRLLAALVAAMFATSLYLLSVQAFELERYCTYCLLSALVTTALAIIVAARWFFSPTTEG